MVKEGQNMHQSKFKLRKAMNYLKFKLCWKTKLTLLQLAFQLQYEAHIWHYDLVARRRPPGSKYPGVRDIRQMPPGVVLVIYGE